MGGNAPGWVFKVRRDGSDFADAPDGSARLAAGGSPRLAMSGDTIIHLAAGVLDFSGARHQYYDDPAGGSYAITATVTDGDGASGIGSTSVAVNNVAPANLQLSLDPVTINENGATAVITMGGCGR